MDRFRTKQTGEAYYIEFDFSKLCGTATISSAVVSAKIVSTGVDATATITTVGSQSVSGTSCFVWVKAGTDGVDYQITCKATASDGSVYEDEGLMLVADVPLTAVTGTGPGLVVAPIIEPVSLAEAKMHLRVDGSDEDTLLTAIIQAAHEHVENITRRHLLTQTHDYCLPGWPCGTAIKLPGGKLQSVTSVKWKDDAGTETTLTSGTDYLVETNGEGIGRIVLPYGESWPSGSLYPSNPITIRYVSGWTKAAAIPYTIKAAVLLTVADLYSNREGQVAANVTNTFQDNPNVQRLLASMRLWDEFD